MENVSILWLEGIDYYEHGCCESLGQIEGGEKVKAFFQTPLTHIEVEQYVAELRIFFGVKIKLRKVINPNIRIEDQPLKHWFAYRKEYLNRYIYSFSNLRFKQNLAIHTALRYIWVEPSVVTRYLEYRKTFGIYASLLLAHVKSPGIDQLISLGPYIKAHTSKKDLKLSWEWLGETIDRTVYFCEFCGRRLPTLKDKGTCIYCGYKEYYDLQTFEPYIVDTFVQVAFPPVINTQKWESQRPQLWMKLVKKNNPQEILEFLGYQKEIFLGRSRV